MPLPGYSITIGERPAATAFPTSTAVGFMVGFFERGTVLQPVEVVSIADAVNKLGERLSTEPLAYDSIEAWFKEGGGRMYVSRINPGAVTASVAIVDTESKKDLKASAKSPGSWGNNIKLAITKTTGFKIEVKFNSIVVEISPEFTTVAEAIAWAANSSAYVTLSTEAESAAIPKTQEVTLTSGTYAPGSATGAQKKEALALFTKDYGPGQVFMPGQTSEEIHVALLSHAAENNRRAVLDDEDTPTASTIAAHAIALRGQNAKFGTMVAPYARIPGLSAGTLRTIPYSAVYAAQIARSQANGYGPNFAAAGAKRGACNYVVELTQVYSPASLETLNNAGVIAAKLVRGVPTTFGNVSLVNQTTEPNWKSFSASRLVMGVAALAAEVAESFEFEQIDGRGHTFSAFQSALANTACMPFYAEDSLYGQTPEEAFEVNVGPGVNTPESIAKQELKAQISLRVSPSGEVLTVEIVKIPITEDLA